MRHTIRIQTLYTYGTERHIVFILGAASIALVFLYILLVGATAFNVSKQERLAVAVHSTTSRLSDLESEYRSRSSIINKAFATQLGFGEPVKEVFAFRKRLVQNDTNAF